MINKIRVKLACQIDSANQKFIYYGRLLMAQLSNQLSSNDCIMSISRRTVLKQMIFTSAGLWLITYCTEEKSKASIL